MSIKEILNKTNHRPWEIPTGNWKFYQEWNDAIFLHYQVDRNELKKLVPPELEVDTFDDKAWISIVAFTMQYARPKYLPSFSPVSNFHEINIRTYVKSQNKSGVYFLSIEGGKKLSCKIAKAVSELPYRYSEIERSPNKYLSANHRLNDLLDIEFRISDELKLKTELDRWLLERYALFHKTKKSIIKYEIHHLEWPMNNIDIRKLDVNYSRFENLIVGSANQTHYSRGVKVLAWGKERKEI